MRRKRNRRRYIMGHNMYIQMKLWPYRQWTHQNSCHQDNRVNHCRSRISLMRQSEFLIKWIWIWSNKSYSRTLTSCLTTKSLTHYPHRIQNMSKSQVTKEKVRSLEISQKERWTTSHPMSLNTELRNLTECHVQKIIPLLCSLKNESLCLTYTSIQQHQLM